MSKTLRRPSVLRTVVKKRQTHAAPAENPPGFSFPGERSPGFSLPGTVLQNNGMSPVPGQSHPAPEKHDKRCRKKHSLCYNAVWQSFGFAGKTVNKRDIVIRDGLMNGEQLARVLEPKNMTEIKRLKK